MVRLPLLTLRGKYTTVVRSMVTSTIYHGEQVRTADCITSAAAQDASVKNTCKCVNTTPDICSVHMMSFSASKQIFIVFSAHSSEKQGIKSNIAHQFLTTYCEYF